MFEGVSNGTMLINSAVQVLRRHPNLLVPLLICWLLYAPLLVAFKFHIPWKEMELATQCLVVFAAILLLSVVFTWSAFILLEFLRQIEMDERPSLIRAVPTGLLNTLVALPIALVWAMIWFVLSVLEAIFSRNSGDDDFNAENVAKTVAGFDDASLSGAFFRALKKGVRMIAFLIYPAIAWEKNGVSRSVKKGLAVAQTHKVEFGTGYVLTELAGAIVFVPPAILFFVSSKFDVTFPDAVWFGTMVYCAFAWSFYLFLEQMFVSELYLWHLKWEKAVDIAVASGDFEPKLADVARPSVLDEVPDLKGLVGGNGS